MSLKILLIITGFFCLQVCDGQNIKAKLRKAYQQFESDSQLRHAISSLYVINAKTGEVVFDKNSQIGLAGASTQKIITAATAFELLGKDYRYKTIFSQNGQIKSHVFKGEVFITGTGDPTLGSWRYEGTRTDTILKKITLGFRAAGIDSFDQSSCLYFNNNKFENPDVVGGWIWDDIGNYYGAASKQFNWHENQYDIVLQSGNKIGDKIKIKPVPRGFYTPPFPFINNVTAAAKGTGDNAYIYYPTFFRPGVEAIYLKGTIPVSEDSFVISGSMQHPELAFIAEYNGKLLENDLLDQFLFNQNCSVLNKSDLNAKVLLTLSSPPLDSIIYWFLKRSINLYGEALVKTFAYEKNDFGSTGSGVVIIKDLWKQKGLDPEEINIKDGSGLSPQNRITTHAQVEILKFAKKQSWFPFFFDALPEFNNMKMKSGTIADTKGYCGYYTAADGNEYIFSFLVNNYSGRSSTVVNKMYKVLDVLK